MTAAAVSTMDATVVIVHRDSVVRRLSCLVLERTGCTVIALGDGGSAIQCLDAETDILIVDLALGAGVVDSLIRRAREVRPSVGVILVAEEFREIVRCAPRLEAGETYLHQPFSSSSLIEATALVYHWPLMSKTAGAG